MLSSSFTSDKLSVGSGLCSWLCLFNSVQFGLVRFWLCLWPVSALNSDGEESFFLIYWHFYLLLYYLFFIRESDYRGKARETDNISSFFSDSFYKFSISICFVRFCSNFFNIFFFRFVFLMFNFIVPSHSQKPYFLIHIRSCIQVPI